MTDALRAVSPLRRRMIDDMSLRNLSPATPRSCLHAVTKFSRYFGRPPDRLGLEDARAVQAHLVSQGISRPGLNQAACALRFFYGVTLDRAEIPERIACPDHPEPAPAKAGVLLGHNTLPAAARYTHVATTAIAAAQSPFDRLNREVMPAIELCRTAALGGHGESCQDCAHTRAAYNSWPAINGWPRVRPICCRCRISMSWSPCQLKSRRWLRRTRRWSMPCCSTPWQGPSARALSAFSPTPDTEATTQPYPTSSRSSPRARSEE